MRRIFDAGEYPMKSKQAAPLFLFLSALLWSMSGIFTKSVAWNGVCLATLRGVIAFAVSAALLHGRKIRLNRQKVLAAICYFAQGTLFMCANKYTTAANATLLQNTSPLYIILFNAALAKRFPKKSECLMCALLFFGVALTFLGNLGGGGALGNTMALVSALFYSGVFFLSKENGANPLESLFLGNGLYLLLLPFCVTDRIVRETRPAEWLFLLTFATLTGIAAWLCFTVGIQHTPALQANFITMSEPVMAPLWTFLLLGERISPMAVLGCVIVMGSLQLYHHLAAKKAQA